MNTVTPGRFADNPVDAIGARVLGSLIEKEITTPDNYPLSLNSLTGACNQTSNREPVMNLEEPEVMKSLDDLARRSLVSSVHKDSRISRYGTRSRKRH